MKSELGKDEFLSLSDGRRLCWRSYGDPNGFPVVYCHGTPSCRLEAGFAEEAARDNGLWLIAPDRPGFGRSDPAPGRNVAEFSADILAIADKCGFERFGLAGYSGGGAYLFRCGAILPRRRLAFLAGFAPWANVTSLDDLNALDRAYTKLARSLPQLNYLAFAPFALFARYWPSAFVALLQRAVSPPDQAEMDNPATREAFKVMFAEAMRQGSGALAQEANLLYQVADPDADAGPIQAPIRIAIGDADIFVPVSMVERAMIPHPNAELTVSPNKGHFAFDQWHEVFANAVAAIRGASQDPPAIDP
ncbi:MAG: alpha/beta hydrolase [Pseudomonadota bacterium]